MLILPWYQMEDPSNAQSHKGIIRIAAKVIVPILGRHSRQPIASVLFDEDGEDLVQYYLI